MVYLAGFSLTFVDTVLRSGTFVSAAVINLQQHFLNLRSVEGRLELIDVTEGLTEMFNNKC